MRRDELVIRGLVREWLIMEDTAAAGSDAASMMSGIEKLTDMLDGSIEDAGEKIENKSESVTALVLGGLLSVPTLIKWFSKVMSYVLKGYAVIIKRLSASGAESAEEMATKVEEIGTEFYHKGHHFIEDAFVKLVKALVIAVAATKGMDSAALAYEWCNGEGEKRVKAAAKMIDFAVTSLLAIFSVEGTIHAIKGAHVALAGMEGTLTAVKAAHISETVTAAFTRAAALISEAFVEAGISAALASEMVKKIKSAIDQMKEIVVDNASTITKAAVAAGISVAVASGTGEKDRDNREEVAQQG
jgi:hypothetical protein